MLHATSGLAEQLRLATILGNFSFLVLLVVVVVTRIAFTPEGI